MGIAIRSKCSIYVCIICSLGECDMEKQKSYSCIVDSKHLFEMGLFAEIFLIFMADM
jgi:hypothetical protein